MTLADAQQKIVNERIASYSEHIDARGREIDWLWLRGVWTAEPEIRSHMSSSPLYTNTPRTTLLYEVFVSDTHIFRTLCTHLFCCTVTHIKLL
jgi:hypothetical protein